MQNRPVAVTVFGVLWILAALLMFVAAAGGLVGVHSGAFGEEFSSPGAPSSGMFGFGIFRYYELLATVQLFVSVVIGVAAVGLLRLASWARRALVGASCLAILAVLSLLVYQWSAMFPALAEAGAQSDFPFFLLFVALFGVASLFWLVPPVLTIWALTRSSVVAAFATAPRQPLPDTPSHEDQEKDPNRHAEGD